ncbi:ATP-NAD kinase-like domain-containing protein [Camillea tinctor]|nr:ATP-NAD kinase-like domain-containing protein [Camillea tinctor]
MAATNEHPHSLIIGSVKPEEIICIRRRPHTTSAYTIFSLKEVIGDDDQGGTSFVLSQTPLAEAPPAAPHELVIEGPPAHLGRERRVHVIVSALSGTGRAGRFYGDVLGPLLEGAAGLVEGEGGGYRLVVTRSAASVGEFARGLGERRDGERERHTVVLLSGDGGVVDMLNGVAGADGGGSGPLIALLPLGTGNALFHSLHKTGVDRAGEQPPPSDLVRALRTLLLSGTTEARLPSFRVDFPPGSRRITYAGPGSTGTAADMTVRDTEEEKEVGGEEVADAVVALHGAIVASYGFHAQLVWESDTPAYRRHGAARFGMVAKELLREAHAYRADVELTLPSSPGEGRGGKEKRQIPRDKHAYLLATLVSNLERTFCISPASRPLDGKLRLVHFGPADGERTMRIMGGAYEGGKHVGMRWGDGEAEAEGGREGDAGEGKDKGEVGYEEVEELRITIREEDPRWRKICIDGTIVEVPVGGTVTVRREEGGKAHLRVLVDRRVVGAR